MQKNVGYDRNNSRVYVCVFHTCLIASQCVSTGEQQMYISTEMSMVLQQCLYAWLHSAGYLLAWRQARSCRNSAELLPFF